MKHATFVPWRKALKPELGYAEARVVWIARGALVALAGYGLVVPELAHTTRPVLLGSAAAGLAASLLFAFLATARPRTLSAAEAAVLVAVALHVAGHLFGLYDRFRWYDLALHTTIPLVAAAIIYALSQATEWIWNWKEVSGVEVGIYLFSMAFAVAGTWEIIEFAMDELAGTSEQDSLFDTMIDLIADFSGALVGALLGAWATVHGRKHGHHLVSEEPDAEPRGSEPVPDRR